MRKKVIDIFEKSEKPLKAGEVVSLSGIDKIDVDKVIKELKAEDIIYSPKRCFYEIRR